MDFTKLVTDLFFTPRGRRIFILMVLVAVFVITVMWSCAPAVVHDSPAVMVCSSCGYRQKLGTAKMLKCAKCGKETGYLWKCMVCCFEFEYRSPKDGKKYESSESMRQAKIESCKCPNCGSVETFPVTTKNMPEKTADLAK